MSKKKERPEYEALVKRIASGELTRQEASVIAEQQTGLSASTFRVWLSSERADDLKAVRGNAGANSAHSHAKNDPEKAKAYEQAIALVLSGKMPGSQAARQFNVNYTYLMRRVFEERLNGQPAQPAQKPDNEVILDVLSDPVRTKRLAEVIRNLKI